MLRVEEVIFSRDAPRNMDGIQDTLVDFFSLLKVDVYPYVLDFTASVCCVHSGPVSGDMLIQITKDDQCIYKSNAYRIDADVPAAPKGKYFVEIVFKDHIRHREALFLEWPAELGQ